MSDCATVLQERNLAKTKKNMKRDLLKFGFQMDELNT